MHAKFVALSALFTLAAAGAVPYGYGNDPKVNDIPTPPPKPNPAPVPSPKPTPAPGSSTCSTGPVQCCNSVQDAKSNAAQQVLSTLGLIGVGAAVGPITGLVGLTCNPISVLGVGGNSCNAQTVCCSNNNFNGVVALGCTPINVNL